MGTKHSIISPISSPEISPEINYKIGVISDTHGVLPNAVFELFAGVDLIIHAGDVGREDLLIELGAIAPVRAVSGNVDGVPTRERPQKLELATPAGRIAVTHGHLASAPSGDLRKMLGIFSEFDPQILIYGHSHIPLIDNIGEVKILNPGSAGNPRFGRGASVGIIELPSGATSPKIQLINI